MVSTELSQPPKPDLYMQPYTLLKRAPPQPTKKTLGTQMFLFLHLNKSLLETPL